MKRTSIILIVILMLSLFSPFSLSAASTDKGSDENKADSSLDNENDADIHNNESDDKESHQFEESDDNQKENNQDEKNDLKEKNNDLSDADLNKKDEDTDIDSSKNVDKTEEKQEEDSTAKKEEDNQEQKTDTKANKLKTQLVNSMRTSKLGHLNSDEVNVYETLEDPSTSFTAGEKYTNQVYYIKRQATIDGQSFYLISLKPSSKDGVVGWVKEGSIKLHDHITVDNKKKTMYFTGKGSAYSKAWGGSKDLEYEDMSSYESQAFHINKTEAVGNNTWYRGKFNDKTIWLHESYLTTIEESRTSKLGHLNSDKVNIYETLGDPSTKFAAGKKYTNQVYYIKRQATIDGQSFYLISLEPSSKDGVVGWVQEDGIKLRDHKTVDNKKKTMYFTGKGSAYSKAWGGSKDLEYKDMSSYKSQAFHINKTETVGNNTWYRGKFNDKTIWLHESYLTKIEESRTSKLGHLNSDKVNIYETLGDPSTKFAAGKKYTNQVYYIKRQATIDGQSFYLISLEPSSKDGVVGWVQEGSIKLHDHITVDNKKKTMYFTGKGSAYSKAWGGSKNLEYKDMSSYKSQAFHINKTETVGNNTWYRGKFNGETIWLHESYLEKEKEVITDYTTYNLTLDKMLDLQMKVNPQTDKQYKLWIREDAFGNVNSGKGTVKGDNWNLRRGPGTSYLSGGKVNNGTKLPIKASQKVSGYTWYHVGYTSGWVTADPLDVRYYLDYRNFMDSLKNKLQFLKLSESANVSVNEVNEKILKGNGILEGKAQSFIDGGQKYNVNEIYLVSHALLETGNGTSKLARGVKYNGKTVYNMYGVGAKDGCPVECGAEYAYNAGWFTPESAIIGGAAFVNDNYVQAGQDTLYKMRWNPLAAEKNGIATHQYATDIGWAYKQTTRMYNLYNLLDGYNLILDIPEYK